MKLRFRQNSLRLRVNRLEVARLASGAELSEQVQFPGDSRMTYVLRSSAENGASASFQGGVISVSAPKELVLDWAAGEAIGLYFDLPANHSRLVIAIEKDLECVDGPEEERDPHAFGRNSDKVC